MPLNYILLSLFALIVPEIASANPIPVGIDYAPPESWIVATLLIVPGIIVEGLVALIYLAIAAKPKRYALAVLFVNLISMPFSWYLLSLNLPINGKTEISALVTMSWLGVLIYESAIIVFEALLIRLVLTKKMLFIDALRISFFCNLFSFLAGLAIIYQIIIMLQAPRIFT